MRKGSIAVRPVFFLLGWLALGLGLLGIPLPGLPTTPFLLLAAFFFSRSSTRVHDWLTGHALFGPPIRDWAERGAISRRAKALALLAMGAVFALSLTLGLPGWALAAQALSLAGVALFIMTRPH